MQVSSKLFVNAGEGLWFDLLPRMATITTTTIIAMVPPWLRSKELPLSEPEAPALVSTAMVEPGSLLLLSGLLLVRAIVLAEGEATDVAWMIALDVDRREVANVDSAGFVVVVELACLCCESAEAVGVLDGATVTYSVTVTCAMA